MIKLSGPQIKNKSIIGSLHGKPVHMVETSGGLHLIVAYEDGILKTLGAGPHRAVAMFVAEKKEPDVKWAEDLNKSEDFMETHCPTCHQEDSPSSCLCILRWDDEQS